MQQKHKEIAFAKNTKIVKNTETITIKPKKGKVIQFEDDRSNENYQTYEYIGDLIKDRIIPVKAQD